MSASPSCSASQQARDNLAKVVGEGWDLALEPVAEQVAEMGRLLRADLAEGRSFLPAPDQVFAAFSCPFEKVRVLIVGQDPYPTPGHPIGLCFSVAPDVRPIPRSLMNIYRELVDDLGVPQPSTGDLTPWVERGVMLLNRSLTVEPGAPASHRGRGWEPITEQAIRALAMRAQPLVAILWGRHAREALPWLLEAPAITSPHPSPLSASRGFFGSRPFSRANELLIEQGGEPIDWSLP